MIKPQQPADFYNLYIITNFELLFYWPCSREATALDCLKFMRGLPEPCLHSHRHLLPNSLDFTWHMALLLVLSYAFKHMLKRIGISQRITTVLTALTHCSNLFAEGTHSWISIPRTHLLAMIRGMDGEHGNLSIMAVDI